MDIGAMINSALSWFGQELFNFGDFLWYLFITGFDWMLARLFDAIIYGIDQIPVPDFFADVPIAWADAIASAGYWMEPFRLGWGLTIYFGALGLRFIIRRIPVIG